MQAVKFLFVVAATVCAVQAAEIPRSSDKLDLRLLVDSAGAISKNIFKAINTALDQSKPHSEKILNEMAPEARAYVKRIIDEGKATVADKEKRFNVIFATLTKALDNLKPIKTCSDKLSPAGKKLALATEKDIVKIAEGIEKKHKKEIDNLKLGQQKLVQQARKLFDTEVPAMVKCLTPGKKDAAACLQKEIDKTVKGVTDLVQDAFVLLNTLNDTLEPIIEDVLDKGLPLLQSTFKDAVKLLKSLADCVATLK